MNPWWALTPIIGLVALVLAFMAKQLLAAASRELRADFAQLNEVLTSTQETKDEFNTARVRLRAMRLPRTDH